ncbi:hypothetical protein TWF281_004387 [Arthrobotrys megalospora]
MQASQTISRRIPRRVELHPTLIPALRDRFPLSPRPHYRRFGHDRSNLPQYTAKTTGSSQFRKLYSTYPQQQKMESSSIADLKRIGRDELAAQLLKRQEVAAQTADGVAEPEKIAIVDVRDSDFIGGHLLGCLHRPSSTFSSRLDGLIEELKDHDKVIFHCALSQQRGPSAALKYIREKKSLEARKRVASSEEDELLYKNVGKKVNQEVYVLDGGFVEWQEKYGNDERLTEGWRKEIWDSY